MSHPHLTAIQTAIDATRCAISATRRALLLLGPDPQRYVIERHVTAVGAIAIGLRLRLTRTRAGRATALIRPIHHHLHALRTALRTARHGHETRRTIRLDLDDAAARLKIAISAWERLLARQVPTPSPPSPASAEARPSVLHRPRARDRACTN